MQFPKTATMTEIADALMPVFDSAPALTAVWVAVEGREDVLMSRPAVDMWRSPGPRKTLAKDPARQRRIREQMKAVEVWHEV